MKQAASLALAVLTAALLVPPVSAEEPVWGAALAAARMPGEEYAGFQRSDSSRALAAGLHVRPIADTASDTLRWASDADPGPGAAMTREHEAELLAEWHRR